MTGAVVAVAPPALNEDVRAAVLTAERDDPTLHCLICYTDLAYATLTPCRHDEICAVCHLRLRHLHSDRSCPICKRVNEQLIVDRRDGGGSTAQTPTAATAAAARTTQKTFDDYPIWGNSLGADFVYEEKVGMFLPSQYYETDIKPLFGYHCTVRGCEYDGLTLEHVHEGGDGGDGGEEEGEDSITLRQGQGGPPNQNSNNRKRKETSPVKALQEHLRARHRLALCNLCVENNRDFVSRLPRLTPSQLKQHLTTGDGASSGFNGHPICKFCKPKRFYDLSALHLHLQKEHYKCDMCTLQGLDNQYFASYRSLERHFDKQHFLCHDVQCLQARFVVFANELDLRHHERTVHGGTSTGSTKINLEFNYRRDATSGVSASQQVPDDSEFNYGLDGEAFVPDAVPASQRRGGDVALHPLHVQRTAQLREQAAAIRETRNAAEAFPTLREAHAASSGAGAAAAGGAGGGADNRLRVGWNEGSSQQTIQKIQSTARPAGKVTEEDFPSLPSAPKRRPVAGGRVAAATPAGRQFAAMSHSAVQPGNWGSGGGARSAAAVAAASPSTTRSGTATSAAAASSNFFTPSSAVITGPPSRPPDLSSADNFPSLGPAPSAANRKVSSASAKLRAGVGRQVQPARTPYSAANSLAKKLHSSAGVSTSSNSAFPSLASSAAAGPYGAVAAGSKPAPQAVQRQQAVPSWDSTADFPAPMAPSTAAGQQTAFKQSMLAPTTEAVATIDDVKQALGKPKFKQLKQYTQQFVTSQIGPQQFIDKSAELFDMGNSDPRFLMFMPSLIETCPNVTASQHAIRYLGELKRKAAKTKPASAVVAAAAAAAAAPKKEPPRPNYSAAEALAKKLQHTAFDDGEDDFPSLVGNPYVKEAEEPEPEPAPAPAPVQEVPKFDSAEEFPAPLAALASTSAGRQPSFKPSVLPPTTEAKSTIEEVKNALGKPKFKQLKQYTQQFVTSKLGPQQFIDKSAELFDMGSADPRFLMFMPSLIETTPNVTASQHAMRYLEQLKRKAQKSAAEVAAAAAATKDETEGSQKAATRYGAAEALAQKIQQGYAADEHNSGGFPSLGGYDATDEEAEAEESDPAPAPVQAVPAFDSTEEFPAPQAAASLSGEATSFKPAVLPPTTEAKHSIEDVKQALGKPKFKQLKQYTQEFVASKLGPQQFVDKSSELFDQGPADPRFLSFMPSLIDTCPNVTASQHALKYLGQLKKKALKDAADVAAEAQARRHAQEEQQVVYDAAEALAMKLERDPSSDDQGADNTNSPSRNVAPYGVIGEPLSAEASDAAPAQEQEVPAFDSAEEFPAPPVAAAPPPGFGGKLVRETVAVTAPPSEEAQASVSDMKQSLGKERFKQLKSFTQQFVGGNLAPRAYVDSCATVFDLGYDDPRFWLFLPPLIETCPNGVESKNALSYMEQLKSTRNGKGSKANGSGPKAVVSQISASAPVAVPKVVPGKQKNAWGGAGGASVVVRASSQPGSVAVAAANAASTAPKQTATKFMADEAKQASAQQHQNSGKKKGQNSKKELQNLAFGK